MKRFQKFLGIILGVAISLILTAGLTFAAMGMNDSMSSSMSTDTTPATAADKDSFKALWGKAYVAGLFTPEQTQRLNTELETASKKLTDNYMGLSVFLNQLKTAKGDAAKTIQKRIDLKEAERDLITSQTKLKLEEFLSKEQVNLILMAGFHGISVSMSGDEHLNNLHGTMNTQMDGAEQTAMDLGKLAGKINQNCEAVTLELIRTSIAAMTTKTTM
ncbi:MAG TPA: hypothetical protein VHY08_12975 [Bacillota bacterium]|nr:hypothetical protein [Bacillota bacterium]